MAKVNNCPLCGSFNINKRKATPLIGAGLGALTFFGGPLAILGGAAVGAAVGKALSTQYRCKNCDSDFEYFPKDDDYFITKIMGKEISALSNGEADGIVLSQHYVEVDLKNKKIEVTPIEED